MDKAQWKVVPVDPTDQMTYIGQKLRYDAVNSIGAIYRAMLAAAPQPPSASGERETVQCNCPGGTKAPGLHAPNCPVRERNAVLIDPYDGGTWVAPSPGIDAAEQKPSGWLVPSILTFAGVDRTSCPPELQPDFEGMVKWSLSIIGDRPPVVDKFGVKHHPRPLYAAPPAAQPSAEWLAEAERLVDDYATAITKAYSRRYEARAALLAHLRTKP